ncbi:MAG: hydrogenase formation protein HypD [Nitrospiraceae bacterium]|nr:hydrogenase formation protein HypD [Nitrospiraceae bacterium]MDA8261342.1 hydrogenase formation protein HypD [Actinomycetota bacterium]
MKMVDEFRDPERIVALSKAVHAAVGDRRFRFMEICGGHTHAIYRFGLPEMLPEGIELIHGPGCPVCVLPVGKVDEALTLTEDPDVILTAFGDVMRVPGSKASPLEAKAQGKDVRMVYSPLDALKLAIENPAKQVVFFAIGFETTAPSTALTILRAAQLGVRNFSVFCNHVTIGPPIRSILETADLDLDGFIGPGHVSAIVGTKAYDFVVEEYSKPVVVSGFEPVDLMESILMLVELVKSGKPAVENQYVRAVKREGNAAALAAMADVFEERESFEWRGLGFISESALRIRAKYAEFDAEARFSMTTIRSPEPAGAICGEVLVGAKRPEECPLMGTQCTPETPVGALMVSSEGACSAYYTYVHRALGVMGG